MVTQIITKLNRYIRIELPVHRILTLLNVQMHYLDGSSCSTCFKIMFLNVFPFISIFIQETMLIEEMLLSIAMKLIASFMHTIGATVTTFSVY